MMLPRSWSGFSVALAVFVGACQSRNVVVAQYPSYTPAEAAIFDDSAAPDIFDVVIGSADPTKDPKLVERTQRADSVVRAKVATISDEGPAGFGLVVQPIGEALAGRRQTAPISLRVPRGAPAFPFVRAEGSRLIGKSVVLFFRRYSEDGEVAIHWRAEPDTHEVHVAVQNARALARIGAPPRR